MSATPPTIRRGAPPLGADTSSILAELGFDDASLEHLLQVGAVAVRKSERKPVS
jgi:crotonobetainyl-CoA:carnitine CoA-transferase CaiB-like acyl-CoA transferase